MIGMNLQIMLIEDNPGDARLIREMLAEGRGVPFDLKNCDRLLTGLSSLAEGGADVILLDLGLPDSQGLDTLRMLHALVPGVPIVVLTISGDEELGLKAVQEGGTGLSCQGACGQQFALALPSLCHRAQSGGTRVEEAPGAS